MKSARSLLAAAVLCLLMALPGRAQYLGQVSVQTVSSTPFNVVACTGTTQTAVVPNLGQTTHYLTANIGIQMNQFQVRIQGSQDGINFIDISDSGMIIPLTGSSSLIGHGYFPVVRIVVICSVGGIVTLNYSGTSVAPSKEYGSFLVSSVDKQLINGNTAPASASATAPVGGGSAPTPFGNSSGFLVAQYIGTGAAGGTVQADCFHSDSASSQKTFGPFTLATTSGLIQNFPIPAFFCPNFQVTYTTGGASAAEIFLDYYFIPPGFPSAFVSNSAGLTSPFNGAPIAEKGPRWNQTSTPAVSTQASASRAAGAAGVRHVADCVTFSAGSTTAPALTKLNINLRDGATGAGTIIQSWTVVIPASTGQNVAPISFCGLNQIGTAATAMTLEFSALLTNLFEDVTLTGYDVQ